jgi:predicted RNA binding protein YcfA (HicA-like mRNA interferase family)
VGDRRRKLLQKLIDHPKSVSPDAVESALKAFGYSVRAGKGSHRVYTKAGAWPLTVPYRRPHLKVHYVNEVIRRLQDEIAAEEGRDDG